MSDKSLAEETEWFLLTPEAAIEKLESDQRVGISAPEVARRLVTYGSNELPSEPPPRFWRVALTQLTNPMNLMLLAVAVAAFVVGQGSTTIVLALLVLVNVVMGANQEMKASASVEALSELQVPFAKVRRDSTVSQVDATGLVPGDIIMVEAGDLVPSDARILISASLEVQESGLTGESAPVPKNSAVLTDPATPLGDRINLIFQNTFVSRGTATAVVTRTGSSTEMGRIAGMVSSVKRNRSPLQRELDSMTKILGLVAWTAVAIIVIAGLARGLDKEAVLLLGIVTGISAIPVGLPTFVQTMLSSGARRLAEANAVVKSLSDVETLGGTTAINSDKTGTLTMNQMTSTSMFVGGNWYTVEGSGYDKNGAILRAAGGQLPDFEQLGYGLALCSDATVSGDGTVVGDPTEAALVVLAAKMGIDAEETRFALPRVAAVPFDSAYKFMATFHRTPNGESSGIELVKGAPDVVIERCSTVLWQGEVVPIDEHRGDILAANQRLSERGLRVLSFAARRLDDSALHDAIEDPSAHVSNLTFVALVGIIDPLRPEAKEAVRVAMKAGIEIRMITGDHTVTARSIADDLGLGEGVVTGAEFREMPDEEVVERLPQLHVFGRVEPEDKLRLAALMQSRGDIVAMTGDAVNDAAALKQADIGVAMGSGSEVTKQAAKMILIDDNFTTLIRAIELGRDIYRRISSYVRLQLTVLSSVLQLMLLATVLNVNEGVALTPLMLLFIKFAVVATIVVALISDVADPGVMLRPPRDPSAKLVNRSTVIRWLAFGFVIASSALALLSWGPDEPSPTDPSISMTMAFGVVALSTVLIGLSMRRKIQPAWASPLFPFVSWIGLGVLLIWLSIELRAFQRVLGTVSLSEHQWLVVLLLGLLAPSISELDKAVRRRSAKRV